MQPRQNIDRKPGTGVHHYRLRIEDTQGKSIYSTIKQTEIRSNQILETDLYPNPATDIAYVQSGEIIDAAELSMYQANQLEN